MATIRPPLKPALKPLRTRPRLRWRRWALWALIVLVAALAWSWGPLHSRATSAASYAARIGCSCRYVAGRDLAQCRGDLESGKAVIMLSEDDAAKSVTARYPLLASQTATWRAGEGCRLEAWRP